MILVTGGSGVLGRALVRALEARGDDVVIASSSEVDLRDASATLALFRQVKPRLVYHMAAKVHGLGGNAKFPAEMFTDNVRMNVNVIDAASQARTDKIVAVSTVATYASSVSTPAQESSIWDGPPHHSEAAYGHAKRAMLAQLEAYAAQHGLRYAYPILTNIYGPDDRFDPVYGHVIPSLIAKFYAASLDGSTVRVWGTGIAERDFLYSEDAARALLLIGDKYVGPINVATGEVAPIRSVVQILAERASVADVEWDSSKPDGQLVRSYDVSRLKTLGFAPDISLRDGLARTYDWYFAHHPFVRG